MRHDHASYIQLADVAENDGRMTVRHQTSFAVCRIQNSIKYTKSSFETGMKLDFFMHFIENRSRMETTCIMMHR